MKGLSVAILFGLVAVASAYPKHHCLCTYELMPLCASNGVSYANICTFECDKYKTYNNDLEILHFGLCEEKSNFNLQQENDDCICTKEFMPLCGSDGVTYSNRCFFHCNIKKSGKEGVFILHDGACETSS